MIESTFDIDEIESLLQICKERKIRNIPFYLHPSGEVNIGRNLIILKENAFETLDDALSHRHNMIEIVGRETAEDVGEVVTVRIQTSGIVSERRLWVENGKVLYSELNYQRHHFEDEPVWDGCNSEALELTPWAWNDWFADLAAHELYAFHYGDEKRLREEHPAVKSLWKRYLCGLRLALMK